MNKTDPDVSTWSQRYGLWPGRTWALFSAYSRWVHLSTNTLPFYNVFPKLQEQFGSSNFNILGYEESGSNHWPHKSEDQELVNHLAGRMERWLRHKDGVNVLLADRSEVGVHYVPDRGVDARTGTKDGEYTPEHVHHNYLHTDAYEKSRTERGVEGAEKGQFLTKGQWSAKGW